MCTARCRAPHSTPPAEGGGEPLLPAAEPGKWTVLRALFLMRSMAFAALERAVLAVWAMAATLTPPSMSQEQYASIGALLKVLPARILPHLWRLFAVRKPVANSIRTPWRGPDRRPRGRGVT